MQVRQAAVQELQLAAKYKNLDEGKHKFKVFATDAAGNTDATAAKDKFKVVDDD